MKIFETKLENVLLIKLDIFEDHRGEYVETYTEDLYKKNGINIKFIQDDISVSTKNVLRGIHGDSETCKLIHYKPTTSLLEGLKKTWNWYLKNQDEHLKKKNYFKEERDMVKEVAK